MCKSINFPEFLRTLMEQTHLVPKAMLIIQGILAACSSLLSQIAEHISGGDRLPIINNSAFPDSSQSESCPDTIFSRRS